jgi:hypothetical protein
LIALLQSEIYTRAQTHKDTRSVRANGWTLMDLSMRESALEEIYVKLMTNE